MTKKHFIDAAEIVRNILDGNWTFDPPPFANKSRMLITHDSGRIAAYEDETYTRAVWTAEAFISLFSDANPRFDTQRFLIACGLAEKPETRRRAFVAKYGVTGGTLESRSEKPAKGRKAKV